MEGPEGALNRVSRAVWTVWGYITGAVGRYLRPEVRNEKDEHYKQEDTVPISQSYKELKFKDEGEKSPEIITSERKAQDDLQLSGVSVRAAAVQWERENIAHNIHEVKVKSKHTYSSAEGVDTKSQIKKYTEKMSDDKRKTHNMQITKQDDSAAYSDADKKNQDKTFPGSEETELHVESEVNDQEQTRKPEEKGEMMSNDESEAELMKNDTDLNVKRSECGETQNRNEEDEQESVDQTFNKEIKENKKEAMICSFTEESLLAKEAGINFDGNENFQEQKCQSKEDDVDETSRKKYNETEKVSIKSEFVNQDLLGNEADLNAEIIKNIQEQRREQKEKREGVDKIMKGENDESGQEPINVELIDLDLLSKEDYRNVDMSKNNQEQRMKQEEKSVDVTMKRYNDKGRDELITVESIGQDMTKILDQNVECRENNEEQREKVEKEGVETMQRKTGENQIQNKFIEQSLLNEVAELNVDKDENSDEKELTKSTFPGQDKVTRDVELIKSSQEQKRNKDEECVEIRREKDRAGEELTEESNLRCKAKQEPANKAEDGVKLLKQDDDETVKDLTLSTKEDDIRSKHQDQKNKQKEEEGGVEQDKSENYKHVEESITSKSIDQDLLTNKLDLYVEHIKKEEHEDAEIREHMIIINNQEDLEKTVEKEENAEIINKGNDDDDDDDDDNDDDDEKETVKCDFIAQSLTDLNVESDDNRQEQRGKQDQMERCIKSMTNEHNKSMEEPIKGEFIDQSLLAKEASRVEKSETTQEQTKKVEEEGDVDKIMKTENDGTDLNEESSTSNLEDIRKPEEKESVKITRDDDTTGEQLLKSEGGNQGLLKKKDDQEQKSKQEEEVDSCVDPGLLSIRNELAPKEQTICATIEIENEASMSQTVDSTLFIQLASTWDETDTFNQSPLHQNLQALIEIPENETLQDITTDVTLNVDFNPLVEADNKSSHRTALMTKQEHEDVNTRPEMGTGNQTEAVETTSQFRAEVTAVNMKKSAPKNVSVHEEPVNRDVTVQEITDQCLSKQESLLKQSADTRTTELTSHEAPFSEIKFKQIDETAVVSLDAMQVQKLDMSFNEAELEATLSPSKQTAEVCEILSEVSGRSKQEQPKCKDSPVEKTYDRVTVEETPLEDQINQNKCTVQYSAAEASSLFKASYLPEIESEQKTLDFHTDSQKDTDEQKTTVSADPGLLDEMKDSIKGVEEQLTMMSGFTKDSGDIDWDLIRDKEAAKRKQGNTNKLESHQETSETNRHTELQDAARACEKVLEAEMTDFETNVVSTGWKMEPVKEIEKPIHLEEENFGHEESMIDSKEGIKEKDRCRLKRELDKISEDSDKNKPSVLRDLFLPPQASSLDFTVQKAKIAVKNPFIRPPKDPRTLINMASIEPLTPHRPHPSQPSFLKKSHIEGASVPGKSLIGFNFSGLDSGFPALRKTEAGRKLREGECTESVTSQKSNSGLQAVDDQVKQATLPPKPKWTPPRQPGMGGPLMMAELKNKLKKPAEE